ncbi:MAG: PAS domain S-box protein [Planctomycetes bacterium]|nr:PAS domain S-box protein [Planctomycetota bacterium]
MTYNREIILTTKRKTYQELDREIKSLRFRLAEAEQTLVAIRAGEVDALVVSGESGEQVYTLKGADHPYRVLIQALNEAAVTLTAEGTILYCNSRFSEMTKTPPEQLFGSSIQGLIKSAERKVFGNTLRQSAEGPSRKEFNIRAADGSLVPALFSVKNLDIEGMTAFCAVITDITDRKRTEDALQKSEQHYRELFQEGERMRDELQRLSKEIFSVQEEERTRISREIHDEIGQALTAISLNVEKLKTNGKPSEVKRKIQSIQSLVEKTSDFIHDLARQIHPSMLEDLGLLPALRSFVRDFQKNTELRVNLKFSASVERASVEQKTVLYRIVQESLTNVLKHSGTRNARVMIGKSPKGITLQVMDNGKGFELAGISGTHEKRQGLGILGMRERAHSVAGTFTILSQLGKGTRVRVHLPLDAERSAKRKEFHNGKNQSRPR